MTTLMEVRDLSLAYRAGAHWLRVLHQVSFSIGRGEVLGLVGESGCGKSTAGLALLGYLSNAARVDTGQVLFDGQNLLAVPRSMLDALRGDRIGFVPQNPTTALNPAIRVGEQIAEPLRLHKYAASDEEAHIRTRELLGLVGLPNPQVAGRRFPHELSGGQQQRVCIAIALACEPELVILDEPTTGLDVSTQQQIITLLLDLRSRLGTAMLYVTHDLGLLGQIADRIGVMYAGHLIELAASAELFLRPRHPYTRGLIGSVPRIDTGTVPSRPLSGMLRRQDLPIGCPFAPRCDAAQPSCASNQQRMESVDPGHQVACQRWREIGDESEVARASVPARTNASRALPVLAVQKVTIAYGRRSGLLGRLFPGRPFVAVNDVSFDVAEGETYALVGESGSGKSTLARVVSGLLAPVSGAVTLEGKTLAPLVRDRSRQQRRRLQFIFQNPDASLNPRARVGSTLTRPLEFFFGLDDRVTRERVAAALADVRLEANYARRFPDQLSGGERQRVAIARALVAQPVLLLCDEILSALDVSVQASIIELLRILKAERKVALLFISHDLAVVRSLADTVGVLLRGELMETGPVEAIFQLPYHPYTLSLLQAVPQFGSKLRGSAPQGESISGAKCAFAGRCAWQLGSKCVDEAPPWRMASNGLAIRCHIPADELADKARAAANAETRMTGATP